MKHRIEIGTFYITNVCNLTCEYCASFNNLNFKGHLSWKETLPRARVWSEILEIDEISILGGEPFAHPHLDEWVFGIRDIWPHHHNIRICTNGTMLDVNLDRIKKYLEQKIIIEISVHDPKHWSKIESTVDRILEGVIHQKKQRVGRYPIDDSREYTEVIIDYEDLDGRPLFKVVEAYEFFPTAIKRIQNSIIHLHHSDRELAHKNCEMKDCHYFVNGILYKCVVQSVGVMLAKQFELDKDSQEIIGHTPGIDPFHSKDEVYCKLKELDDSIRECSLCPEQPLINMIKIYPLAKTKVKF